MKSSKSLNRALFVSVVAFFAASVMMLLYLYFYNFAPFGSNSLAGMDINISQMDLYGYLKDVLTGHNTLGYTFSMGLGGDPTNVISYSMTSPLNLLIVLFEKKDFPVFFNVVALLKIGLIAGTGAFYFERRFCGKLRPAFSILLGLSIAFSQYSIAQICNVYWLDGVIMLPLILLGVYRIIESRSPYLLSISVALAILFNWYSGVICCLFSIFWFVLELMLYKTENKISAGDILKTFFLYAGAGIVGGLLSFWLFLPTLNAIRNGSRGELNTELFSLGLKGNPLSVLANDYIGARSSENQVSLFCGSFAVLGCISYFLPAGDSRKRKVINGVFLIFIILSFYWQPLYLLFSMLKKVASFWSRYSFIGIFTITFIAAQFYSSWDRNHSERKLTTSGILFLLCLALLNTITIGNESKPDMFLLLRTFVFILGILFLLILHGRAGRKAASTVCLSALSTVIILELFYGAVKNESYFYTGNAEEYSEYVSSEQALIDSIKEKDDSPYRITKSSFRGVKYYELGAHFNEGFGYGYWSLSSYTNSPDERQTDLMTNLGYPLYGANFYIVNTSNLAADSLLGVKYYLSPYHINGYVDVEGIDGANGKRAYENPYCLPIAFVYPENSCSLNETDNPFSYINELYSSLIGEPADIFIPLQYKKTVSGEKTVEYTIGIPEGNYSVYGNLPWKRQMEAVITDHQGEMITEYSKYRSPTVFYIPSANGSRKTQITLAAERELAIAEEQFYAIDLDRLNEVTKALKKGAADEIQIDGSRVRIKVDMDSSGKLFTSIPYEEGWSILDNGEKVEPDLFEHCLMQFDLEAGSHVIEMHYTNPSRLPGILLTLVGVLLLTGYAIVSVIHRRSLQKGDAVK